MKEKNGEHPCGDVGQLILLVVFLALWSVDSFFLNISTFYSSMIPLYLRIAFLAVALILSLLLGISGHKVTSHDKKPDGVVTKGAFKFVRHPLYLASILFYVGMASSTVSLISIVFIIIIFLFHNYIAGYEETLLEKKYGESYKTYKGKTGKWLPKFW